MEKTVQNKAGTTTERPPVIVVMGHIDHGKSTLLDYIRHTNVTAKEAGGITQHLSAYEVDHVDPQSKQVKRITFLDTPGHEAFSKTRSRGASVADIAILVVSAEDGVMPQTMEALQTIQSAGIPFIVAINKIDSPKANVDRAKQNLAEKNIMIEEWGGTVPAVPISAKTGQNINDLLDVVLLVAEIQELKADASLPAEGVVIEAHRDPFRGIAATILIKNGTLKKGDFVAVAGAYAPVRLLEDFKGSKLDGATFSSPVSVVGWSDLPEVGSEVRTFSSKKDAEAYSLEHESADKIVLSQASSQANVTTIPLIVKTSVSGTIEAIIHELKKIQTDRTQFAVVQAEAGAINEADMKRAASKPGTVIVGFGTTMEKQAALLQDRMKIDAAIFNVIYDLTDWLKDIRDKRTPKITVEEIRGSAKILKVFNNDKHIQVAGGRVEMGSISKGAQIYISRRGERLGRGSIKELQKNKAKTDIVFEGDEFGIGFESKIDIAPGDVLETFELIEK